MLVNDIIKIHYVREGYLPDYPYHLISDEEMYDAFLNESGICYFYDYYDCPDDSLREYYDILVNSIKGHIAAAKASSEHIKTVPDWVYSYMLGQVIYNESDVLDRHHLLTMLNMDNLEDEIGTKECIEIYRVSTEWLYKLVDNDFEKRPPTLFGEPHVIKYLRLAAMNGGKILEVS